MRVGLVSPPLRPHKTVGLVWNPFEPPAGPRAPSSRANRRGPPQARFAASTRFERASKAGINNPTPDSSPCFFSSCTFSTPDPSLLSHVNLPARSFDSRTSRCADRMKTIAQIPLISLKTQWRRRLRYRALLRVRRDS